MLRFNFSDEDYTTESKDDIRGCKPIIKLKATSFGTNAGLIIGNHNSRIRIRNMAAEYGDTLLLLEDSAHLLGSKRVGIVFKCNLRSISKAQSS